jgi:hypothetical protein
VTRVAAGDRTAPENVASRLRSSGFDHEEMS